MKPLHFIGSLLVLLVGIGIFVILMTSIIPESNRELVIAFVSTIVGAISGSLKQITGVDSKEIEALHQENEKLKADNVLLNDKIVKLEAQVNELITKL